MDKFLSAMNKVKESGEVLRAELTERVVANSELTVEHCDAMSLEALVAIDAAMPQANYGGRAVRASNRAGKTTELSMPSVDDA